MIPIRVRRRGGMADVLVDLNGHTIGQLADRLDACSLVVDGRAAQAHRAAAEVLRPGSDLGGELSSRRPALWELGVAAGPGSGHRFLLRAGRYAIGRHQSAGIRIDGGPEDEVVLTVAEDGWAVDGTGATVFDSEDGPLLRIGTVWLRLRRYGDSVPRPPGRVNRPPRRPPPATRRDVPVPEALDVSHRRREMRWAVFVGPMLIGGAMAVFFQPIFAMFALLGPLMAAVGWIEDRAKAKRSVRRQAQADIERVESYRRALQEAARAAEDALRWGPGLLEAATVVRDVDHRLWERRGHHDDAGAVVVGYGSVPLGPGPMPTDPVLRDAATTATLEGVPVAVDLAPGRVLVVIEPREEPTLAGGIVAQAATWRGPGDLRIAVVTDRPDQWSWVKWLPHGESDPIAGTRLLATERPDIEAVVQHCRDSADQIMLVVDLLDPVEWGLHHILAAPHVAAVVSVTDAASIPGSATQVIEGGVLRDSVDTRRIPFDPIRPDPAVLDELARTMAGYEDPERLVVGSRLPASIALRTLEPDCDDPDGIRARWAMGSQGLEFTLGIGESGPLVLDLVSDGPHCLVAGTTGSGKSELLRTMVASMASSHSPEAVNFVLVDYKGGSAFDACSDLPHVVGLVTDLDGRLAERAKVSLLAELRRRENILRERNAEDIAHYRRLGGVALPRLVIVVDEFAALAADVPSFLEAVIDFAQRGRSLGVHVVLATQRPAGVVSEPIRANTNLRISLRVQSDHDARDVVGDAAPAELPRHLPGRAFVRTGPGEMRTFQTATVTAAGDDEALAAVPFVFGPRSGTELSNEGVRHVDGIVAATQRAAAGRPRPFRPWRNPLPDTFQLSNLDGEGLAVGLEDQPHRQTQVGWAWDPTINLALVGTPQSGASDTLEALVVRAATSPEGDDLAFYVIAGSGSSWSDSSAAPVIGDVVAASEPSRLRRLITTLSTEVETRRRSSWSRRIVVAVDGIEAVLRALEKDHALREAFMSLAAAGPAVGITMVVVGNRLGALPASMSAAISRRLLFNLADPFEYAAVGLKAEHQPANVRGRCVDPLTGHEIQMAKAPVAVLEPRRRDWILPVIEELPAVCKVDEVAGRLRLDTDDWFVPVGIGDSSLVPVGWTLGLGDHALVVGPARSGKTSMLAGLAEMFRFTDSKVVAVAPSRSWLHEVVDLEVLPELTERLAAGLGSDALLLVDDAFRLAPEAFQALLAANQTEVRIVATARPEEVRSGYTHWTKALRDRRTGLILNPGSMTDGELLGCGLPRHLPTAHPGRGFLVGDGTIELCQAIVG